MKVRLSTSLVDDLGRVVRGIERFKLTYVSTTGRKAETSKIWKHQTKVKVLPFFFTIE